MREKQQVWNKSRYGRYYQRCIGRNVQMPVSETKRYVLYYQRVIRAGSQCEEQGKGYIAIRRDANGSQRRIGWREASKYVYRYNRYNDFYCKIYADPKRQKNWNNYLKRINNLKKQLKSLGKVPTAEDSLAEIMKYCVKLINVAAKFQDSGMLYTVPMKKAKSTRKFSDIIISLCCRENAITISWISTRTGKKQIAQYINLSKERENATYNNILLGMYTQVIQGEDTLQRDTAMIDNENYFVDVMMSPITNWINKRVQEPNDSSCYERHFALADANMKIQEALLNAIDKVLE